MQKTHFQAITQTALAKKYAFACWKLPKQNHKQLLVDFSEQTEKVGANLDQLGKGFLVSPFVSAEKYFIQADFYLDSLKEKPKFSPRTQNSDVFLSKKDIFSQEITQKLVKNKFPQNTSDLPVFVDDPNLGREHYINLVKKGIENIEKGVFQKVVLSKCKTMDLPEDFDLTKKFYELCDQYPNAFVSLVFLPKFGLWIGASPEILISQDQNQVLKTVALAGTQANIEGTNVKEVQWSQKEIEEQAMVCRYIISCFKKIRLREYEETGPKTVKAGNLWHLRTDFEVNMKQVNFPNLASTMLDLLHPTSAVCGTPKNSALNFILENENYDRNLYSGYWGTVNIENESHLFVNLRCAQIWQKQVTFYAGAGITQDSIPEKEWTETEIKCNTLQKIILGM